MNFSRFKKILAFIELPKFKRRAFSFSKLLVARNHAFTLIELLIVIAIIAIIATIIIVSISNSRSKAQDTKRKADLNQIKTALQVYHLNTNLMPINRTPGTAYRDTGANFLQELIDTGLFGERPKDPISPSRTYAYYDYGHGAIGTLIVSNLATYSGTGLPGSCRPFSGSNWCRRDLASNYHCLCVIH